MKGLALQVEDRIQNIGELMRELDNATKQTESVTKNPVTPAHVEDYGRLTAFVPENQISKRQDTHEKPKPAPVTPTLPNPVTPAPPMQPVSEPPKSTPTKSDPVNRKAIIAAAAGIILVGGIGYAAKNSKVSSETSQTNITTTAASTAVATAKTTVDATTTVETTTTAAPRKVPVSDDDFTIEMVSGDYVLTKYKGKGEDVVIPDGVTRIKSLMQRKL